MSQEKRDIKESFFMFTAVVYFNQEEAKEGQWWSGKAESVFLCKGSSEMALTGEERII